MIREWFASLLIFLTSWLPGADPFGLDVVPVSETDTAALEEQSVNVAESTGNENPMNIGRGDDELTYVYGVCDYDELAAQASNVLASMGGLPADWRVDATHAATSTAPRDWFATADGYSFNPCNYSVTFTNKQSVSHNNSQWSNFPGQVRGALSNLGWRDDMWIMLTSSSTKKQIGLALLVADGPNVSEQSFLSVIPDTKMIKLAKVTESRLVENFEAYRNGQSDSACPCHTYVTLQISGPIDLEPLMQ